MNKDPQERSPSALASLRRFIRPRAARERCELCGLDLGPVHAHLVELESRRLCCACDACGILFENNGAGKYRRVPRRVRALDDLRLTDAQWAGFDLPINLAFFLTSTPAGRVVAFYPSPAGATEALPPQEIWQELLAENPNLHDLEPDVEALLVNRLDAARLYYRLGIDECYRLVGLIRTHWRGFSGEPEVWKQIGQFFAGLKERSETGGRVARA